MQVDEDYKVRGFQEKPALPDSMPGDPDNSLLWALIGTSTLNFMPQSGQLPLESVEHVKEWINSGASLD